jgi:hypothetical protein
MSESGPEKRSQGSCGAIRPDDNGSRSNILPTLASLFVVICLSVTLVRSDLITYQLNADSIYLINLTKDVVFSHGSLNDWKLSAHYYFMPDGFMAAIAVLFCRCGLNIYSSILVTYISSAAVVASAIWHRVTKDSYPECLLAGALVVAIPYTVTRFCYFGEPQGSPVFEYLASAGQLFGPALHGGTLLFSFLLFVIASAANDARKTGGRILAYLIAAMGGVLASFSDLTALAWGLAPLSIVLLLERGRGRTYSVWGFLVVLWVFSIVACRLAGSWNPVRADYIGSLYVGIGPSFASLIDLGARSIGEPLPFLFLLANAALWFAAARAFLHEASCPGCESRRLLIFAGAASLLCLASPVAMGLFGGTLRLLLPYLVLAPLAGSFALLLSLRRSFSELARRRAAIGLCTAVFAGSLGAVWSAQRPAPLAIADCLKERGMSEGAADYWDAGPIRASSRWTIQVAPLVPGKADSFSWLARADWGRDFSGGKINRPGFILATKLNRPALMDRFGAPSEIWSCASREIFVYR